MPPPKLLVGCIIPHSPPPPILVDSVSHHPQHTKLHNLLPSQHTPKRMKSLSKPYHGKLGNYPQAPDPPKVTSKPAPSIPTLKVSPALP
ncbi:hypothetical protein B9Z19DRAFT_756153 [Tuber borchii]|uniref:Uncharacterized protein n=1 Tax=Tuber borchii TaxID=42251 RepID=A0A2T6ZXJ5_TUBBO|nr:hypothetical protein B9Z19DRAFT_756153 [Tuber borchii]